MALLNDWEQAGDGILLRRSIDSRAINKVLPLRPGLVFIGDIPTGELWRQSIDQERESREWVALTKSAANAAVDANEQPEQQEPPEGVDESDWENKHNWEMHEDSRVVGSYKVTREAITTTRTLEFVKLIYETEPEL